MEYRPLGECVETVIDHRGLTPKKLQGDWSQVGYRAISAKNIKNGMLVNEGSMKRVDSVLYKRWMTEEIERGSIFITSEAPFGEVLYWDSDEKLVLSQRVFGLKARSSICDARYLYYWMRCPYFQRELMGRSTGTTVTGLRQPELLKCAVAVPDLEVQKKMACALSIIDRKIALNNRLNDYLDEYASALFEDWISRCTETATIGDIAQEILDYTKYSGPYVKLINSSDVTEGIFPDPEPVENKDLKGHFKKRFKKHDILYSEIRPRNHHYGYVMFDAVDWISTTRLMVIRNRPEKISSVLLYYYLKSRPVTEEFTLKTETRSGTFPQGKYIDMAAIEVPYLPVEKQAGIAQSITTILETIYANQAENERLVKLRDTLLPKLMSGEMNVSKIALPAHSNNH